MNTKRNVGIEILRIISMLMIVMLHVLLFGLKYNELNIFSMKGAITNLLEAICFCAVNIYAIITGYVLVNKRPKINRLIDLWFQVIFYLLMSCILIFILYPQNFSKISLIFAFIPVITNKYWYFTGYFVMFWCIPLYNWIISNLTMKQYRKMIFVMLFVFCLLGWISSVLSNTTFGLNYGYSFLWLSVLYFLGAGIKLYGLELFFIKRKISQNTILFIALFSGALTFISKIVLSKLTMMVLGHELFVDAFYSYLSPTVLIETICLVIYFSNLKIRGSKALTKISGATFGVYLIHQTPFFTNYCWNFLSKYRTAPIFKYILVILVSVICIYVVCTLIEMIRSFIFDKLRVCSISNRIAEKINKLMMKFE